MLVELKRSSLGGGEWYLRPRGQDDWMLVSLPDVIAARIEGESAWFSAERDARGWRIERFVMALAVSPAHNDTERPPLKRAPNPGILRSVT